MLGTNYFDCFLFTKRFGNNHSSLTSPADRFGLCQVAPDITLTLQCDALTVVLDQKVGRVGSPAVVLLVGEEET